jgi:hypothetical protein
VQLLNCGKIRTQGISGNAPHSGEIVEVEIVPHAPANAVVGARRVSADVAAPMTLPLAS